MPSINDLREAVDSYRRIQAEPPTAYQVDAAKVLNVTAEQLKRTRLQMARIRITDTAIAYIEEHYGHASSQGSVQPE